MIPPQSFMRVLKAAAGQHSLTNSSGYWSTSFYHGKHSILRSISTSSCWRIVRCWSVSVVKLNDGDGHMQQKYPQEKRIKSNKDNICRPLFIMSAQLWHGMPPGRKAQFFVSIGETVLFGHTNACISLFTWPSTFVLLRMTPIISALSGIVRK